MTPPKSHDRHMISQHELSVTYRPSEDVVFHPEVRVQSRAGISANTRRCPTHTTNIFTAIRVDVNEACQSGTLVGEGGEGGRKERERGR